MPCSRTSYKANKSFQYAMAITPQEALQRCIEHRELFHDEMMTTMRLIMSGEISPELVAGLLVALRTKKETVGELAAAAQVMREFATAVDVKDRTHLVDVVGTGGDGAHTFNISTAAMFVAAAAGAKIAKHGNRSVSSKSGSADVLEALGVNLALNARSGCRVRFEDWCRFYVRTELPSRHEKCSADS